MDTKCNMCNRSQECFTACNLKGLIFFNNSENWQIYWYWSVCIVTWKYTDFYFYSGPWFKIRMTSYQHRKSHCGDKRVIRLPIQVKWHLYIESGLWLFCGYVRVYGKASCSKANRGSYQHYLLTPQSLESDTLSACQELADRDSWSQLQTFKVRKINTGIAWTIQMNLVYTSEY